MGRDLNSAQSAIQKYAQGEAELGFAKERKKKGIFGGVMDNAIEQHFKEEEQKRLKDELRSMFQLYGSAGQWERLQATIARARKAHKEALEEQARKRDIIIKILIVSVVGIGGLIGIYYWAMYLKG